MALQKKKRSKNVIEICSCMLDFELNKKSSACLLSDFINYCGASHVILKVYVQTKQYISDVFFLIQKKKGIVFHKTVSRGLKYGQLYL